MDATVKFEALMTVDDLTKLRDKVDQLIRMLGGTAHPQSAIITERNEQRGMPGIGDAVKFIEALWGRIGDENKKLVYGMALKFPQDKRFNLVDLAKALDIELPTLKAYNRALGRTLGKTLSLYCEEDSPGPFGKEWDEEKYCQTYRLPKDIRDAILRMPNLAD